jgi:hypothetical protein
VHAFTIRQEVDRVMRHTRDLIACRADDRDLRLLDDAGIGREGDEEEVDPLRGSAG